MNRTDLVVRFPIPMTRAWANIVCACSTMLLFKSENDVAEWTAWRRIPRGDIQPLDRVLERGKRWHGEHLPPDWTKKSSAEACAIVADPGSNHRAWFRLDSQGRF